MTVERSMWKPLQEERDELAEVRARRAKVTEMVAWLRAQYRALGCADPSRTQVATVLDGTPAGWEALQEAVGRKGSPSPATRAMVLDHFPEDGEAVQR
jgi:hypothetical protein